MNAQSRAADHLTVADPAVHKIVPSTSRIEKLATGFGFTEGPVWLRNPDRLLFSDIPNNSIFQLTPAASRLCFANPAAMTRTTLPPVPSSGPTA